MGWLARLKEWASRDPIGSVDDPELGPLVLNDGGTDGCWTARVNVQGKPVCFEIGGRYEPDPVLIERARDIVRSIGPFSARVSAFLAAEAARPGWEVFTEDIRLLSIQYVCLFWPNRPDEGMIFFDGSKECLCWRCDLIGEIPTGLTFDR